MNGIRPEGDLRYEAVLTELNVALLPACVLKNRVPSWSGFF